MIKTPLSTVIGGAFWTPGATVIGGNTPTFETVMKKLFANGEQGFFYDPNDLSTMFQDAAGTVPVTDVGQSVGLVLDKSGRNNHAFQTTSASRPILRKNAVTGANYLEFDGADDFLQTANIDFADKVDATVVAGFLTPRLNVRQFIMEYGGHAIGELGAFTLEAPTAAFNNVGIRVTATTSAQLRTVAITPNTACVTTVSIASNHHLKIGVYGGDSQETPFGSTAFGIKPMTIGVSAGDKHPFNGHIYGLIGIGKLVSDIETAAIEKELAKRAGVTLSV